MTILNVTSVASVYAAMATNQSDKARRVLIIENGYHELAV